MTKVILIAVLVASPRLYAACVLQGGVGADFAGSVWRTVG